MSAEQVSLPTTVNAMPKLDAETGAETVVRSTLPTLSSGRIDRPGPAVHHSLYFEELGRADGVPFLVVHGGPGHIIPKDWLSFFAALPVRVIVPHQRGAGLSSPAGEIRDNTTDLLVEDLEALRSKLGIERWHVLGWSFGTTVATLYSARNPERVASYTGYGTFLGTRKEEEFLLKGFEAFDPAAVARMREFGGIGIPSEGWFGNGMAAALGTEREDAALRTWAAIPAGEPFPDARRASARLSLAYGAAEFHLRPGQVLEEARGAGAVPAFHIHGEADTAVPIASARALGAAWPGSRLVELPEAGHKFDDPMTQDVLGQHVRSLL